MVSDPYGACVAGVAGAHVLTAESERCQTPMSDWESDPYGVGGAAVAVVVLGCDLVSASSELLPLSNLSYPVSMVCGMNINHHSSQDQSQTTDTDDLVVDCATCVARNSIACDDCLVTYICDREPGVAVIISMDELRSMRALSNAGLVPALKHSSG